ncbi:MAG: FecR domain-containing protein, partial [Pyrinomonadaceae bacterium]
MKQNFKMSAAIGLVCLLTCVFSFAQNDKKASSVRDAYLISAKAGGVNFVSGNISVFRADGSRSILQKGDALEIGDKISTKNGKAEILLNPGSFVRLAENTEFEFENTSLDDLAIKISRGSAIFEIITTKEFQIAVNSRDSRFYLLKSG